MSNDAGENGRFRADTLVSIEELQSEELILENPGDVHNLSSPDNTGDLVVGRRTGTLFSLEENDYSDDFYSTAESRSSEFIVKQTGSDSFSDTDTTSSFSTAPGAEKLCSKLCDGESVHLSIDDHDQYSSDFENCSREPSSRVGVSQIQEEITCHARLGFIAKKVEAIKSQDLITQKSLRKIDQFQPTEDHQSEPLKNFVRKKVKNIQQKLQQPVSGTTKESHRGNQDIPAKKDNYSTLVNTRSVECLKIDNLFCKMKNVSKTKFHVPENCFKCRKANGVLAEEYFMRRKLAQLKKQEFEDRLERHFQQDALVMVADIINSGPKPSDPPHEIWDRLLRKVKCEETTLEQAF